VELVPKLVASKAIGWGVVNNVLDMEQDLKGKEIAMLESG